MKEVKWELVWTAIICITFLELIALMMGMNGVLLTSVLVVIAGLAGWTAPQMRIK